LKIVSTQKNICSLLIKVYIHCTDLAAKNDQKMPATATITLTMTATATATSTATATVTVTATVALLLLATFEKFLSKRPRKPLQMQPTAFLQQTLTM
jgi:hypothetical protein